MKKIVWETQFLEYKKNGDVDYSEPDDEFSDEEDIENVFDTEKVENLMSTPFGVFKIDHKLNPYYNYKFYVGHTNFDITHEVSDMIEQCPGVEVLRIISRYRFIIAVGNAFDQALVRKSINNLFYDDDDHIEYITNVVDSIEDEYYQDFILTLVTDMDTFYNKWILAVKSEPEFDHEFIGYKKGDDEDKYLEEVKDFKKKYAEYGLLFEKP
jgi:hypothetical protein